MNKRMNRPNRVIILWYAFVAGANGAWFMKEGNQWWLLNAVVCIIAALITWREMNKSEDIVEKQ